MTWDKERYKRKNGKYIPVEKVESFCGSCSRPMEGRPDKIYCGDYCRMVGHRANKKIKQAEQAKQGEQS